ncbi:MAG: cysteine-rich CWC family protein [Pseudolabrys sp.]|nr:cysteine-rich CWC family protein [Pseudolabrys sp.]
MTAPVPTFRRLVCARCGAAFDCSLAGDCWCAAEPVRLPMPGTMTSDPAEDCLCPACLRRAATQPVPEP